MNKNKGKNNGGRGIRTAICQIFCLDGDREGNLARIEHALAEASEAEARLADANSCHTPDKTIEFGKMLEQNRVEHFEEPCPNWEYERTAERQISSV